MYISQIGKVFKSEIHEEFFIDYFNDNLDYVYRYTKKGETFKGLLANSNYLVNNKEEFFESFELWENENGVGTLGRLKNCELISINEIDIITVQCKEPIFVGDFFSGSLNGQVVYAQGVFNSFLGIWSIDCKLGVLTPVLNFGVDKLNKNNEKVLETLKQVKTSIDNLASEITKLSGKAVSEVITTGQATSTTTSIAWDTAITNFNSAITQIGVDFQNKINEVEEYLI